MFEDIKKQFSKVIAYSQGISDPKVDDLFDKWLEAKRDFIEIFDGELIYEYPQKIIFHLDNDTKQKRLDEFIDFVANNCDNLELSNFIEANMESFFDNKVSHGYTYRGHQIPEGMKLIKSFKFFEESATVLDIIQTKASAIIQENKIEGTLCFSVHPLDYLSVSENTYNWRSCHALDGEYRGGNLSYMVDKSTIVCYLKGADDIQIPMFPSDVPWNSKKWRVLIYFSNTWKILAAGRQYPFSSPHGLDIVRSILTVKMNSSPLAYSLWDDCFVDNIIYDDRDYPLSEKYIPVRGELLPLTSVVEDDENSLQFNDLLRSSCYTPMFSIQNNSRCYPSLKGEIIHVGGPCKCLKCEQELIHISESVMCDNCEQIYGIGENDVFTYCDCCNARIRRTEASYVGNYAVCEYCYEKYCFTCDRCSEVYYSDEIHYHGNGQYCEWCYSKILDEEE